MTSHTLLSAASSDELQIWVKDRYHDQNDDAGRVNRAVDIRAFGSRPDQLSNPSLISIH